MYKVLIRPLRVEDASTSYKWRNDEEIWKYTGSKPDKPITLEIERDWLFYTLKDSSKKRFAIEVDDKYVGNIQLTNITNSSAEYHIFIGNKEFWNKGIAKLASYQIIRFAKEILKIKELYLYVNPLHKAAIKLYKNLNFQLVSNEIKMSLPLDKNHKPMVSVFMMAYNHEKYIQQAIESVLMQKVNFDFDIVIGEDKSTDNTRLLITSIAQKYPGKFKLLLHEKNVGPHKNQNEVFNACNGSYIAMCEGDDYWINPNKLQKQIDFLDNNANYSICFHNTLELKDNSKNKPKLYCTNSQKEETTITELFKRNIIPTCSVIFKNKINDTFFPKNYQKCAFGDWYLHLLNAQYGNIRYLNDVMGVHRIHDGSVWTPIPLYQQIIRIVKAYPLFMNEFPVYKREIVKNRNKYILWLIDELKKEKKHFSIIKYSLILLISKPKLLKLLLSKLK